jgi:hypothetical protein
VEITTEEHAKRTVQIARIDTGSDIIEGDPNGLGSCAAAECPNQKATDEDSQR